MDPITMHVYECANCESVFGVEDEDEIAHEKTTCPICSADDLYEIGYGKVEYIA